MQSACFWTFSLCLNSLATRQVLHLVRQSLLSVRSSAYYTLCNVANKVRVVHAQAKGSSMATLVFRYTNNTSFWYFWLHHVGMTLWNLAEEFGCGYSRHHFGAFWWTLFVEIWHTSWTSETWIIYRHSVLPSAHRHQTFGSCCFKSQATQRKYMYFRRQVENVVSF